MNQVKKNRKSRTGLLPAIAIATPIVFFILLEGILRIAGYGHDLSLFVSHPDFPQYNIINPDVGMRYYVSGQFKPEVSNDAFLKTKKKNSIRLFFLGGSSAAGYPYLHNGAPSRILRSMLEAAYPGKQIEVINVAMTAVNSFTLVDLLPEIIDADPDGILVYAGHNEFYGALGAGSVQNIGDSPLLIHTFLNLIKFRSVQLIRNLIYSITASSLPEGTLMKRMVARQTIPRNSELYKLARRLFRQNLSDLASRCNEAGVPVAFANLVSNIRDMPPFISVYPPTLTDKGKVQDKLMAVSTSVDAGQYKEAKAALSMMSPDMQSIAEFQYLLARSEERLGNIARAKTLYNKAKDLDGLRFRASEDFNRVIKEVADKYQCLFVDVEKAFTEASPNGIIGHSLILEHLHPNLRGYYLIAKTFYQSCFANGILLKNGEKPAMDISVDIKDHLHTTLLDSLLGAYRLKILLNDWPFTDTPSKPGFVTSAQVEKEALALVMNKKTWEKAHFEMANYFQNHKRFDLAAAEFVALKNETPYNSSPYIFLARTYLQKEDFERAKRELLAARKFNLSRDEKFTTAKYLGSIYVQQGEVKEGIRFLESAYKINHGDKQLLFNLVGAHILARNIEQAELLFKEYQRMTVSRQSIAYLGGLLKKQKENLHNK